MNVDTQKVNILGAKKLSFLTGFNIQFLIVD